MYGGSIPFSASNFPIEHRFTQCIVPVIFNTRPTRWNSVLGPKLNYFSLDDVRQTLEKEKGVQFKRLPDDVISEFLKVSLDVLYDTASKDPHAMRIYESYMDYRKRAIELSPTDHLGYLDARSAQTYA